MAICSSQTHTVRNWERRDAAHQVPIMCHVRCLAGRYPHYTDRKPKPREVKPMGPGHTVAERWSRRQTQGCLSFRRAASWAAVWVWDARPCWRVGRGGEGVWPW